MVAFALQLNAALRSHFNMQLRVLRVPFLDKLDRITKQSNDDDVATQKDKLAKAQVEIYLVREKDTSSREQVLDALCHARQEGTLENTLRESDIDAATRCKQTLNNNRFGASLEDGTLGTALTAGRLDEVRKLKTRIKDTLDIAVKNGTLHGALSKKSSDEAYRLKSKMKDTLEAAVEEAGTLNEALPNKMSEGPCSLKSQIKDTLDSALKAGTLNGALPNQMSEEPCSLTSQMKHTLESAVKAGVVPLDEVRNSAAHLSRLMKDRTKWMMEIANVASLDASLKQDILEIVVTHLKGLEHGMTEDEIKESIHQIDEYMANRLGRWQQQQQQQQLNMSTG